MLTTGVPTGSGVVCGSHRTQTLPYDSLSSATNFFASSGVISGVVALTFGISSRRSCQSGRSDSENAAYVFGETIVSIATSRALGSSPSYVRHSVEPFETPLHQ